MLNKGFVQFKIVVCLLFCDVTITVIGKSENYEKEKQSIKPGLHESQLPG